MTHKMKTRIAMGQLSATPSIEENLKKAAEQIDEAAARGAELILFPEVGFEQFFPKYAHDPTKFESAQKIPGQITDFLCRKAKETNIVIVASLFEEGNICEYYDSAVCIDSDGTLLGVTRMVHTYENEGYNEKYYYGPGNTIYPVYETNAGNVGIAICYDSWFPEAVRALVLRGADIILVPTVEVLVEDGVLPPSDFVVGGTQYEAVTTMQKANAIVNGVWVAVCNRVGLEEDQMYMGSSLVIDPWGHIVNMANDKEDEVLVTDIDLNECKKTRMIWPTLKDRRPDTYDILLKPYASEPYYNKDRVRR
ncbi:MAG: nitrilase-related carbon-nitrogen hydrolase [Lachnotalea sp.]